VVTYSFHPLTTFSVCNEFQSNNNVTNVTNVPQRLHSRESQGTGTASRWYNVRTEEQSDPAHLPMSRLPRRRGRVRARHEEYNSLQHCQEVKYSLSPTILVTTCAILAIRKISPFSKTILILVGANRHIFHVQKDLLALHSGYFKDRLAEIEQYGEQEISLPGIDASGFAEFACWLLGYSFMPANNVVLHADMNILDERFWQLGAFLRASGFRILQ
jgi:hypothetical protein